MSLISLRSSHRAAKVLFNLEEQIKHAKGKHQDFFRKINLWALGLTGIFGALSYITFICSYNIKCDGNFNLEISPKKQSLRQGLAVQIGY